MTRTAAIGALLKLGFVACVALGTTQVANAAPITLENDVELDWSLAGNPCPGTPGCPAGATVIGAPRLVPNASDAGASVFIEVSSVSDDVNRILLGFNVLFDTGSPVFVFGIPLQLGIVDVPVFPLPDTDGDGTPGFELTLGDFPNFDQLPTGVSLIFTLFGEVRGNGNVLGQSPAVITVTGAGEAISQVEQVVVPEPSTLLLLGSGIAAIARRRAARR